jgi:hypothetical protein
MPALPKRAEWMAQVMADVFSVQQLEAKEALMKESSFNLLTSFFSATGPSHLFVYYQP